VTLPPPSTNCCPTGANWKKTLNVGQTEAGIKVSTVVPTIQTGHVCWEATATAIGTGLGTTYYINMGSSVSQTSVAGSLTILLLNGIDDVINKTIKYVHSDGSCWVADATKFTNPLTGAGVPPNTIEFTEVT
jgi:hypothetical protein